MESREYMITRLVSILSRGETVEYYEEPKMGLEYQTTIKPEPNGYSIECSILGFNSIRVNGHCDKLSKVIPMADELASTAYTLLQKTGWR